MYENTVKNTVIYHKRYSTIKIPKTSGVVGNFLLWERSHGIMVTYPIVIRGGGLYLNKWSFMKGKNSC